MNAKILGLSKKQEKVLEALLVGADTPLSLARKTGVSRTAVYAILENLKKRGLVRTRIVEGRKYWKMNSSQDIFRNFFEARKALGGAAAEGQSVYEDDKANITVYRGAQAVRKIIGRIFADNKNSRIYGLQGDTAIDGWNDIFSEGKTNEINRLIKQNKLIVEAVLPAGWFERHAEIFGQKWVKDFEGRMSRAVVLGQEYFRHGGQMIIFKKSLYLLALDEKVVVEIKNSAIQKMLLSVFEILQGSGKLIDPNMILRESMNTKN